jgi:hypothetical protein
MTRRRQALRSREPLATLLFFSLILVFLLTLIPILAKADPAGAPDATPAKTLNPGDMNTGALLVQTEDGTAQTDTAVQPSVQDAVQPAAKAVKRGLAKQAALFALLLVILSAVTLVLWRYHRRDFASPRRNGRRI